MNNAAYKLQVFYHLLDIAFKKIKINFSKTRNEKKIFELLKISNITIDEHELSNKFKEFDIDKEPVWEFSLKNWS